MVLVSGLLGLFVLVMLFSITVDVRASRKIQREYLDAILARLNEARLTDTPVDRH